MKATMVRDAIGAIVAIVLIVLVLAAISVVAGWNIPILRDIAGYMGIQGS